MKFTKYNENLEVVGAIQSIGSSATTVSSLAIGNTNTASGIYSQAFGNNTTASNNYSHASGSNSIASGIASFVHGSSSTASGTNTIVLGANITGTTANTTYVDGLNIKTITGTSVTNLGIDGNGYVVAGSDIYTSGLTFNNGTFDLTVSRNDDTNFTVNLGLLASDVSVTGGTYDPYTGVATFTTNSGGTFGVSGFMTGLTDTYTSAFTYSNNVLTIERTAGKPPLSVTINTMTGLTVTGTVSAQTINGSTILSGGTNLINIIDDRDNFTTGSTLVGATAYFDTRDTLSAYTLDLSSLDINDTFVTGGTYSNPTGIATFTNNSGGTFNVSGFFIGSTDVFTTGSTLIGTTAYFDTVDTLSAYTLDLSSLDTNDNFTTGSTLVGTTAYFDTVDALSAYTLDLSSLDVNDTFVSGGTYNNSTGIATYTNNDNGSFTITGFTTLNKFTQTTSITGNTTYTVTHNLNSLDVISQFKDLTGNNAVNITVDNYQVNSLDITSVADISSLRVMLISL